ncbi:MAG TPA: YihY/virulence factor BrkB family protein [Candidatus Acidoferrum sp.]|jgi:membrane protein
MIALPGLVQRAVSLIRRVFPRCSMISQAIAYNLFLAFFPTLLIAVGFATSPVGGKTGLLDLITDLTTYLPPGSQQIVSQFLVNHGPEAWKWALLGWTGTLIAGSQVMKLLMEGIHIIYGDKETPGFLHRQLRGLLLLLLTIAPLLVAAILGVFGRPLRHWLFQELGNRGTVHMLWALLFPATAMLLAMIALTIIYRVARSHEDRLRNVVPGAMLATILWWVVNALFGFYVRRVPYGVAYGGLAAVIGMLIWMHLSAMIIFLGAAWNAELAASRREGQ